MIRRTDALMIVDVQRDFLPGGALAVEGGDEVVPVLNRWLAAARRQGVPVFATRDWHPPDHISFAERDGPWPRHCVQNTPGAEFAPDLNLPPETRSLCKGRDVDAEQYSPFDKTDLDETLRNEGIQRLWIGGLAQDVCVRQTVLDARNAGFDVHVLAAATRPVNPDDGEKALQEMQAAGAVIESRESPE